MLRGHDLALLAAGVTFYAMAAVVPAALIAVRIAGALRGGAALTRLADAMARALPDTLGADDVVRHLVATGRALSPATVLIAVVPATLYVEGLRRAVGRLDPGDPVPGWRGRLLALPLVAVAPLALLALLGVAPLLADLLGAGGVVRGALGVYVALNVDWLLVSPVLVYLFRALGGSCPSWRACLWGGFSAGAFVAGFLQGFVLFLALPLDLGRPFGGYVGIGAAVAVGLWLWVLNLVVLVGYALTVALDSTAARPREGGPGRCGGAG